MYSFLTDLRLIKKERNSHFDEVIEIRVVNREHVKCGCNKKYGGMKKKQS